ncbi:gamma-glutamyltransferase [Lichenihabitans sp. Uapishka_5]|nr:gamma-glutamyltransferase [Lichenihabitans sp. Uapishka_5]MDX7952738.1 gamma-glutamyltransferase [Lichenihabitans sp. Uapishka_5]
MVVSAQHEATEVGAAILAAGGNAIDAAVAVGYALAVVYPAAGNLGGGGFMTLRLADGRTTFLDFREKAPLAATATLFQNASGQVVPGRSTESWLAVGVPGTVAGLEAARERYGHLSRSQLIGPALRLAREGFVLDRGDAAMFASETEALAADPQARAIFTHDGQPLQAGDRLLQPELATSLERIVATGADSFRDGPLGAAIAQASAASQGLITRDDFAHYAVREMAPITCGYRGTTIISAPPPSSGGVTLCETLNILEGFDLHAAGFHTAREAHLLVEAMRRSYRDRNTRLGDPAFVQNPVAHLTDKAYAATLRAGIAAEAATPSVDLAPAPAVPEGDHTTHFSVVDRDGNAVAVTYTLNGWFGAHRVAGDTGILMNNEMDDFTAKPGVPNMFGLLQGDANAVAPGKTPLSSMSPTIVIEDNHLAMVTGSPGGSRIISIVLQVIVNAVDHGMTVAEAVDAPRLHHQYLPDVVDLEPGALSAAVRDELVHQGYAFRDRPAWGHAETIMVGGDTLAAARASWASGRPLALFGANDRRAPSGSAVGR